VGITGVILDTHIFLWWLFDDPRLPVKLRKIIQNVDNSIYVSAASVWEIATKFRLGKLPEAGSVAKNVPAWIEKAGFLSLDVTPEHAQLAGTWTTPHPDPFDRMLAAQAKLERIPLVTMDCALQDFSIEVISG
jgi:PIN domain nuclease of toxin-antitoxin system